MSTSKSYHHGDLAGQLIKIGLDLLREVGPADLSLRAVARRAGVSAMAPYRHFADKDALLAGIAGHGFDLFAKCLTNAAARAATPAAGLRDQGCAYVGFAIAEPALFRLMFGPMISSDPAQASLARAGAPSFIALERAVQAAHPTADDAARHIRILACWSVAHGLACLIVDGKIALSPDMIAQVIGTLS